MIEIRADGCMVKVLGYQHENDRAQIRFPLDDVRDMMYGSPGGAFTLAYRRPFDEQFYVSEDIEIDGDYLIWTVGSHALAVRGDVAVQITYSTAEQIAKTQIFRFKVSQSIDADEAGQGDNLADLIEQALIAAGSVHQEIAAAEETLDAAVADAQAAQRAAEAAQGAAEGARDAAAGSARDAAESEAAAEASRAAAAGSAQAASGAQAGAEQAQQAAAAAQVAAEAARDAAAGSAAGAAESETAAAGSAEDAAAAKVAAEAARDQAQTTVAGIEAAGDAQVQRVNMTGDAQVQAVNTAGSTQTGNVNAAGATQVAAVQSKGTEVLDSIPEDYTETVEEVSELKSAITNTVNYSIDGEYVVPASYIEQGSISSNGSDSANTNRLRTRIRIPVKNGSFFTFTAGSVCTGVYWYHYANNGTVTHASNWLTNGATVQISANGELRFMFKNSNGTDIVASSFDATVTIHTALQKNLDNEITARIAKDEEIKKAIVSVGIVNYGEFATGQTLFTSSVASAGDILHYKFSTSNAGVQYIRLLDSNNTSLRNIGKTASGTAQSYNGEVIIPEGFAKCDTYCSSDYKLFIEYLYVTKADNAVKKNEIFEQSQNLISTPIIRGRINVDTGETYSTPDSGGSFVTQDIISVEPGKQYTLSFDKITVINNRYRYGYASDNSFIGRLNNIVDYGVAGQNETITIPSNVYGIKYQFGDIGDDYTTNALTHVQFEEGGLQTPYVAYNCVKSELIDTYHQYKKLVTSEMNPDLLMLPDYYFDENYIQAKCDTINGYMDSSVAFGDAFVFITDEHWEDNAKRSPAMLRYIFDHTTINKLISGGDIYDGNHDYDYPAARDFMLKLRHGFPGKIWPCVGNHDLFKQMPTSRLAALFDMYHDNYNGNPLHHYYYVDNERAKIRYIVIADYYESETDNDMNGFVSDSVQQQWFANDALNLENGWGAVIITHQCWYNDNTSEDPTKNLKFDTRFKTPLIDVINNYNGNGEIICVIQGHTHTDRILHTNGNSGTPVIITTCDKYRVVETPPDVYPTDRQPGTIREQAFDVMIINRTSRTIYAVRCGCEAYDGTTISAYGSAVQVRTVSY